MHIEFHGAAREVTGSCHLFEVGGKRFLVDCGLIQGARDAEARNSRPFPFDPKTLDAVILTHGHIDHSGRLPLLEKSGYRGPIYAHPATRDLCRIMLKDAGYLQEREAEWENRKRERKRLPPVEALYTMADAAAALRRFRGIGYSEKRKILPGVEVTLLDAGHILGAAIVILDLEEKGARRRVVLSGDLGHSGTVLMPDPATVDKADLVIMESTYGDRNHRSWERTWAEMSEVFDIAARKPGNVLIPAFAVGRTQELLFAFRERFREWELDRWRVFLDSPMAIEATEVYYKHANLLNAAVREQRREGGLFDLPNLHLTRTAKQSMSINRIHSGAIVIAGSGMCNGGRIKQHLKQNIWRANCHVVFVGYQAAGTLGRSLVDGARRIRLWGETINVEAKIHTVGGFSAHADADGLSRWVSHFPKDVPVVLVHGETDAMQAFQQRLSKAGRAKVHMPLQGVHMDLSSMKMTGN